MLSILDADEEKMAQQDKLIKKLDDERDQMVQNNRNVTKSLMDQDTKMVELQSTYSMLKLLIKCSPKTTQS